MLIEISDLFGIEKKLTKKAAIPLSCMEKLPQHIIIPI